MRIKVNGRDSYMVHFYHTTGTITLSGETRVVPKTICSVHAGACVERVRPCKNMGQAQGEAFCSPRDTFNKEKGRQRAFKAAIDGLPREVRTKLWAGYRETLRPDKFNEVARQLEKLAEGLRRHGRGQ